MTYKLKTYLDLRKHFRSGDIVEFGSASVLGRAIRWFTKKDVNHTAIVIRSTILPDRVFLLEALSRGLTPNFLSMRLEETKGAVYWLPLKRDFDDRRDELARWTIKEFVARKPKYDYRGLIGNAFSHVSIETSRYFCSEFVHRAWAEFEIVPALDGGKAARPGEFEAFGVTGPRQRLI